MNSTHKRRTPTKNDKESAEGWLLDAQRLLQHNEYYRVKQLCNQVIRVLRREDTK